MTNSIKKTLIILGIIIASLYVYSNWQYWTQDEQEWKMLCTLPEKTGHIQTVNDYRICLAGRGITPNDSDIRKMCFLYSKDEYDAQATYNPTKNSIYSDCLHEQGLSD